MGIDAEEYFSSNNIADTLENECERVTKYNQKKEEINDIIRQQKMNNIKWDDVYRIESVQKDGNNYFVLVHKRTKQQLYIYFKTRDEAILYAKKRLYY